MFLCESVHNGIEKNDRSALQARRREKAYVGKLGGWERGEPIYRGLTLCFASMYLHRAHPDKSIPVCNSGQVSIRAMLIPCVQPRTGRAGRRALFRRHILTAAAAAGRNGNRRLTLNGAEHCSSQQPAMGRSPCVRAGCGCEILLPCFALAFGGRETKTNGCSWTD